MASTFRMRPMTVDGAPVSGGTVRIPIRFSLPRDALPANASAVSAAAPSPAGLSLAHRVAVITTSRLATAWSVTTEKWKQYLTDMSPQEQSALNAFEVAFREQLPNEADRLAEIYARQFSEKELAELAVFFESDTGRAWLAGEQQLSQPIQMEVARFQIAVGARAVAQVCVSLACPAQLGSSSPKPAGK